MSVNMTPPTGAAIRAQALPPLNRNQAAALAAIQGMLFGAGKPCLLEGRAGTGKTRLVVELVRRWHGRVAGCPPTHKSAFVLLTMTPTRIAAWRIRDISQRLRNHFPGRGFGACPQRQARHESVRRHLTTEGAWQAATAPRVQ